jgi:hypothetical protein
MKEEVPGVRWLNRKQLVKEYMFLLFLRRLSHIKHTRFDMIEWRN